MAPGRRLIRRPKLAMRTVTAAVVLLAACSAPIPTPTATPGPSQTATPTPAAFGSPSVTPVQGPLIVMAAGDIACDPVDPDFNAGMGTPTRCRQRDTASLLAGADLILALGDNQYECGGLAAFQGSFDRSWGAYRSRIRPTIGNHEHNAGSEGPRAGTGCDASHTGAGYYAYFGSAAPGGEYSFDAGGWHFATVDTTCGPLTCAARAAWLTVDLARHRDLCTLVYYHHARWSSGKEGNHPQGDVFWRVAAAAGVEIVLNGHDHDYERFAPMDAAGRASATGIREFVVGTGGYKLNPFRAIQPNSLVRNNDTFGVLQLTLRATGYDWQFLPIAGQTFTDSGTGTCH